MPHSFRQELKTTRRPDVGTLDTVVRTADATDASAPTCPVDVLIVGEGWVRNGYTGNTCNKTFVLLP